MTPTLARRLFDLVEPIAVVTYQAHEPTEAVMALGPLNVWDAYFAGRAAPLGRDAPAEVVHALFYNFADGEVARHVPHVWDLVSPEAAIAARQQGSVAAPSSQRFGRFHYPPNPSHVSGMGPTSCVSTAVTVTSQRSSARALVGPSHTYSTHCRQECRPSSSGGSAT